MVVKAPSKFKNGSLRSKRSPWLPHVNPPMHFDFHGMVPKGIKLVRMGGMNVRVKGKVTMNDGGIVSDRPLSKEQIRQRKKELKKFLSGQTQEQRAFGQDYAKKLHEKMKGNSPNYTRRVGKVVVQGKVVGSLKGLTGIV